MAFVRQPKRRKYDASVVAVLGDRSPLAPVNWHLAPLGIDTRTLRRLWLIYDATAVQLIRWLHQPEPEVASAIRRAGYEPWRCIGGYPIWIRHRPAEPRPTRQLLSEDRRP
jgi:hypothetical protein